VYFREYETNIHCEKRAKTLSITADGTCSDHCALKWCSASATRLDNRGIGSP